MSAQRDSLQLLQVRQVVQHVRQHDSAGSAEFTVEHPAPQQPRQRRRESGVGATLASGASHRQTPAVKRRETNSRLRRWAMHLIPGASDARSSSCCSTSMLQRTQRHAATAHTRANSVNCSVLRADRGVKPSGAVHPSAPGCRSALPPHAHDVLRCANDSCDPTPRTTHMRQQSEVLHRAASTNTLTAAGDMAGSAVRSRFDDSSQMKPSSTAVSRASSSDRRPTMQCLHMLCKPAKKAKRSRVLLSKL